MNHTLKKHSKLQKKLRSRQDMLNSESSTFFLLAQDGVTTPLNVWIESMQTNCESRQNHSKQNKTQHGRALFFNMYLRGI